MMFPKITPYRSEKYRAFVRREPCDVCGRPGPNHFHHEAFGERGMSTKVSDLQGTSLCPSRPGVEGCHDKREREGFAEFWNGYNPAAICLKHLNEYLSLGNKL